MHPGGHFSFDLIAEPASYSLNTRDLICIFNQCSNRVRRPLETKPSPCFPCLSIRLAREDPIPSGGIRSAGTSERNSIFAISPDCHQNQEGKAPRLFSSDSSSLSNPESSLFRHLPLPFPSFFPPSLLFFLFSLDHDGRLDWKKLRFRFRELSRTTFSSSPVLECELTRKGMIVSLRGESITIVTFLEYRCRAYKTFHRDFNCFHRSSPSNDLFINVNWKLLDRCCVKKSSEGSSYKSSTFSSMNYKLYFNILQWYNSTKYPAISVE